MTNAVVWTRTINALRTSLAPPPAGATPSLSTVCHNSAVENFTLAVPYWLLGSIMLELAAPLRTAMSWVMAQKSRKPVTGLIRISYSLP